MTEAGMSETRQEEGKTPSMVAMRVTDECARDDAHEMQGSAACEACITAALWHEQEIAAAALASERQRAERAEKALDAIRETLNDEVVENMRLAHRCGFAPAIEAGMAYSDAQVQAFDTLRRERDAMRKALEEIAATGCTGIGSPPSCTCRTCIARRALGEHPHAEKEDRND